MSNRKHLDDRIWDDSFFLELNPAQKCLFLFYLTNPSLSLCPIFEISEKMVLLRTQLEKKEFEKAKQLFSQKGKIFFYENWVFLPNFMKYNSGITSIGENGKPSNTLKPFIKELQSIPKDVLQFFSKCDSEKFKRVILNTDLELADFALVVDNFVDNSQKDFQNNKDRSPLEGASEGVKQHAEPPNVNVNVNTNVDVNPEGGMGETIVDNFSESSKKHTLHWIKTHHDEVIANLERLYPDKDAQKAYDAFIRANSAKNYKYADYLQALQNWIREDRYREYNKTGNVNLATGKVIAPKGKYAKIMPK